MIILGISAYYHDAAASILVDGKVVAASSEERFSRIKHDNSFPVNAIKFCVKEAKVNYTDIDFIVFYEKPFVKFERILTSHIAHAPKGFRTFVKSMPIWLKERLNMVGTISKSLNVIWNVKFDWDIRFVEHHLSHAAMAYFTSGFSSSAILVIDAVGENATTSIMVGKGERIECLKQQRFPNSIGLLYSSFTYFLGFSVNADEYKVMGLAPYGSLDDNQTRSFIEIIKDKLVNIGDDGSIILNQRYFTFMYGFRMINPQIWGDLFGVPARNHDDPLTQSHMNLAAAIQYVTEQIVLRLAKHIKDITMEDSLCIVGGCALNCAAMGKIKDSKIFKNIHVPFACGDDGGSIGAAMLFYSYMTKFESANLSPYLGPEYPNNFIEDNLRRAGLKYTYMSDEDLFNSVAALLSTGHIVGWFQGRMEFGPRALGNRSILANPCDPMMKNKINSRIKFREGFRPFAPAVLQEDAIRYFDSPNSPHMTFTTQVKPDAPDIPAVTHVDRSARIQTVTFEDNSRLYKLLKSYKQITGISVLLNTSFNVMGEPIVCSPNDAIHTFLNSGLDILVINNYIVAK